MIASEVFCDTGRVLADAAGADLVSCDAELDGDVYRLIGHSDRRLDQRHEEEWEPDDADQGKDYEATHPIFDNFLLLLSWRVWKFLENCVQLFSFSLCRLKPLQTNKLKNSSHYMNLLECI